MEYDLIVKGLKKNYYELKLDVAFNVEKGKCVSIIGDTKSGKTAILKLILNYKDSGEVTVLGKNKITDKLRSKIGIVFNENIFYNGLTVKNVVSIMRKIYSGWNNTYFKKYGNRYNLPFNKTLDKLTRLEKMLLAIDISFSHNARIIMLDDPFSGFNSDDLPVINQMLYDYITHEDTSFLIISKNIENVEAFTDSFVFLKNGKVILQESKDNIIQNYGICKCTAEEFKSLDDAVTKLAYKKDYGYLALVSNKVDIKKENITDIADLNQLWSFISGGEIK